MGKRRIVIDTNIIISALGWNGLERKLYKLCIKGEFDLYISKEILEEFIKVLDYPKFQFSLDEKKEIIENIMDISNTVVPKKKLNVIKEDPSDNKFLECATEVKAQFIITGDKHLLKLGKYGDCKILTTSEFFGLINR